MRHIALILLLASCYGDADLRGHYERGRNECILPLKQQFQDRCKKSCVTTGSDGKAVERPIVTDMTGDPAHWMCGCVPLEMVK